MASPNWRLRIYISAGAATALYTFHAPALQIAIIINDVFTYGPDLN